jgi:hypothetical protein
MPITDITKNVEEQVLGVLTIAQETVVDGVQKFAEAVDPIIPDVPRPFATEAAQLVDGAFTFAEKLLHSSHTFVGRLFDAADTTPDTPAPATSAKAAPTAASSSTAKASAK